MTIRRALIVCAMLALTGCPRSTSGAPVRDLPAAHLRVRALDPVAVTSSHRDTLTLRPGTRSPTVLTLEPGTAISTDALLRTLRSDGGLQVRYRVTRSEGGSGGPEATVDGTVQTARHGSVKLTCHAQAESDEPERDCLALLATLSEP